MPYTRKALRRLTPRARQIAAYTNDLEKAMRGIRRLLPHLVLAELDYLAKATSDQLAALEQTSGPELTPEPPDQELQDGPDWEPRDV